MYGGDVLRIMSSRRLVFSDAFAGIYAAMTVKEMPACSTVTAANSFNASGGRLCSKSVRSLRSLNKALVFAAPVDEGKSTYPDKRTSAVSRDSDMAMNGHCYSARVPLEHRYFFSNLLH